MVYTTARVYAGSDYEYALAAPGEAVLHPADGSAVVNGERVGGAVRFIAPAAGSYWLAVRTAPDEAWTRPVRLEVDAIADPEEVRLLGVVAALDQRILDGEGVVFQVNDSGSGSQITTIGLAKLRHQRDVAAAQLADYRRQRSGRRTIQWRV